MKDILTALDGLRRPSLLIRAARIGAADYRRDAHLRAHFGYGALPRSAAALARLVEMEAEANQQRQSDRSRYSPARHVDLLIAMMGEARLLRGAVRAV